MTAPLSFPNIRQGQTIQDPGLGAVMAQGIAGLLASMQQQKENEYRQQQLAQQAAQQQALEQYYQGQIAVQQGQLSATTTQQHLQLQGQRQVGQAQQAALGMGQPSPAQVPGQPMAQPGTQGVFQELIGGAAQTLAPSRGNTEIFGGVAPEHMADAVKGVQEVQALAPKAPDLPTAAQEEQYYQALLATDPQRAALFKKTWLDKHPSTVVNVGGEGEDEYDKQSAEARVKTLGEVTGKAKTAVSGFRNLDEAYKVVDKSITGFGAKPQLTVARVLSKMGVAAGKDAVENSQTFMKLTSESQLDYLRGRELGSGTAVSDGDREFTARLSAADLTLDPGAIKKILRINVGVGIMRTQDAVTELREQARMYPRQAPNLLRQARELENQLKPIQARYDGMLSKEGMGDEDRRKRIMDIPGIQLPGVR